MAVFLTLVFLVILQREDIDNVPLYLSGFINSGVITGAFG
jgi:hypothetical protein